MNHKTNQTNNLDNWVHYFIELRKRLIRYGVVFFIVFGLFFYFNYLSYEVITQPLIKLLPIKSSLIATSITTPFFAPIKLALFLAFLLTIPYLCGEIWYFITPALYVNEKKWLLFGFVMTIVLFYTGVLFSYFVVLPLLFHLLIEILPHSITIMPDLQLYLDFTIRWLITFGFIFEIPIAISLLVKQGLLSTQQLIEKRPLFIIAAFTIGMLITPPDVTSQIIVAVPMCILYEMSIFLSRYLTPKNCVK